MSQDNPPALQERSRQTRARLVAALDQLLTDRDFEAVTMADLAAEAGLSVGAVYRRFRNKEALIPVIFDLYRDRLAAFTASRDGQVEPDPAAGLHAALEAVVRAAWTFLRRDGHLIRATHLYGRLRPDLVGDDWQALLDQALDGTRQLVDLFADEIARPDPDETARMLTYLLNTLPIERALYPSHGVAAVLPSEDDRVIAGIVTTLYGYLTAPEPGTGPGIGLPGRRPLPVEP